MKSRKLFEISYILNFLLFVMLIAKANINSVDTGDNSVVIIFSTLIGLAAFLFDWACFILYKLYKSGAELSSGAKVSGTFAYVIFTLLTLPVLYLAITTIVSYFTYNYRYFSLSNILYHLFFWMLTITSVYLNIMYWVIRKQINVQMTKKVTDLGNELAD
jgi:hypothetical protein